MQEAVASNTNVDKILQDSSVKSLEFLLRKETLTREDINEILSLMVSNEIKTVNLSGYDRWLIGKFYAWIREFSVLADSIFDALDEEGKRIKYLQPKIKGKDGSKYIYDYNVSVETLDLLERSKNQIQHSFKYMVNVYLYLSRSTLSVQGKAFERFTTSRVESVSGTLRDGKEDKKSILGGFGK